MEGQEAVKTILAQLDNAGCVNKQGEKEDFLQYRTIGLYFTASWCPPCRTFTPQLDEAYRGAKANGKSVQIVFCSCDQDQNSYDQYHENMSFARLPFDNKDKQQELAKHYGVSGIPFLVLVDTKSNKISCDGRGLVNDKKVEAFEL